jgi:hypothetical protein
MGARSECPDACYICSHGISTKAFEAIQHEQHGLFTAIDEGSMVGYGIANVSNTRDRRTVGSSRANVCSEFSKSSMVKSPARIQSTSLTRCRRRRVCIVFCILEKSTAKIGKPIGQNKRHRFNVFDKFAWASARVGNRTFLFHAHMHTWPTVTGELECTYAGRERAARSTCEGLQMSTKEEI